MTFLRLCWKFLFFALIGAGGSIFLSGTAAAARNQLIVSPGGLLFGKVVVGTTEILPATLLNSGSTSVTVSSITSNDVSYSVQHPALPVSLSPGQSMSITVAFTPGAMGATLGTIAINGGSVSLPVGGLGRSSKGLYATPASLGFGSLPTGSSSAASNVVLTNGKSHAVTIAKASTTSSAFVLQGLSLPLTLAAGQSFTFQVAFSPASSGPTFGYFRAMNMNGEGEAAVLLTGTGSASGSLSVSPSSLSFGNVTVGSSASKTGTLTAAGSSITVSSDATTSPEFTISGISLPATIPSGQSVSYTVTFVPQTGGAASAMIAFKTSASGTASTEPVSGTGVTPQAHSVDLAWNPSISPTSGYNVYRGTISGGPYSKLNSSPDASTTYVDSSVSASQTYYYVTTAVNSSGQESAFSNQVQAVIP